MKAADSRRDQKKHPESSGSEKCRCCKGVLKENRQEGGK